jgi:hypothetical protein
LIALWELAMTITDIFFVSAGAIPRQRRGRSVWKRFLDRIMEGRMQKAEREIAEYLQRHARDLPPDPPR